MTAAHIAVQELVHRYAQCIDDRDVDGALALFVPDATFTIYAPGSAEPRATHDLAQFRAALSVLDRYVATMHVIASHTAHIEGTHGTGVTRCVAHHIDAKADRVMYIRYEDTYVHHDHGGWLFAARTLRTEAELTTHVQKG